VLFDIAVAPLKSHSTTTGHFEHTEQGFSSVSSV